MEKYAAKKDIVIDGQNIAQQEIQEAVHHELYSSSSSETVSYNTPSYLTFIPSTPVHISEVYIKGADSRYLGDSLCVLLKVVKGVQYVRVDCMRGVLLEGCAGIQTAQTIVLKDSRYPTITGYAVWDGTLFGGDFPGDENWGASYFAYPDYPSSTSESSASTQIRSSSYTEWMTSSQSTANSGEVGSGSEEMSSL